jgi:integrase
MVYVIDILYRERGEKKRYRHDAQVQHRLAAEAEHRRLLAELGETGTILVKSPKDESDVAEMTFKEAVEFWRKSNTRKHTTVRGYNVNLDAHLLPRLGARPLTSIGFEDVTMLRAALAKRETSTTNNIETALRAVLRFAKLNKKLAAMPELPALRKVTKKVITPPHREDIAKAIEVAYPAAKLAMALAAYAGLRAGEVRGLRFMDVDLARRLIVVRQAICRGQTDVPKSGNERAIPISEPLLPLLITAFRRPHDGDEPVSISSRGEGWAEGSLRTAFQSVLTKLSLPAARLHDLRHFFVTECFRSGIGAPDVQALAGHLHLSVTQSYAHTDAESQRRGIEAFSQRMMDVPHARRGS